ncbi:MAG: HAD-IA family hydrolase [Candidatus Omnitrophota bacterium]
MNCPFKLIILDLGNVLINFNHWIAANKFAKFSPKKLDYIYNLLFDSKLTHRFEEGKLEPQDFFLAVKGDLELKLDYNQFIPIWNEIFFLTSDNVGVYQLVKTLKERFKVVLLSNINRLHFEYLKDNFKIFDPFDKIVTSYEVGLRKPDAKIYQYALNLFSFLPSDAFYIDDRSDLIEEARRLSIAGAQFKSLESLKPVLESVSILEPQKDQLVKNNP